MAIDTDSNRPAGKRKLWDELRDAELYPLVKVALYIVAAYFGVLVSILLAKKYFDVLWDVTATGQFGDSFGALTSILNALAFAAVVATVVLQSRELRESRIELAKQASAQQAWASAAEKQIELMKELEAIRIRPVVKAEWHHVDQKADHLEYVVRNVGLGVARINSIELRSGVNACGAVFNHGSKESAHAWKQCIAMSIAAWGQLRSVQRMQFDDMNRSLAPNERQALVRVRFRAETPLRAAEQLKNNFSPTIHYSSINGEAHHVTNLRVEEEEEEVIP